MKKLIISLSIAVALISCGSNGEKPKPGGQPQVSDEQALQLKEENEGIERAKEAILDSINLANTRQRIIDSMNTVAASEAVATRGGTRHLAHHVVAAPPPSAPVNERPRAVTTDNNSAPTNTTAAESEKKKKGLNNAAKGSLIGLGTGAAAGALLDANHRGQGAIFGGIIGAVGGAVSGAVIDKHKKKKAEQDTVSQEK